MEFNKDELERFASNIVIKFSEAPPSKYKQIRIWVKEIIDEFWDEEAEDEFCPTCDELLSSQMDANLNIYLECPSCGYKLHEAKD